MNNLEFNCFIRLRYREKLNIYMKVKCFISFTVNQLYNVVITVIYSNLQ